MESPAYFTAMQQRWSCDSDGKMPWQLPVHNAVQVMESPWRHALNYLTLIRAIRPFFFSPPRD
jgi:hypothetical protein